jgi:nucleotide-binding universal stress UspA family protein
MFERILVGYAGDRAGRDAVVLAALLATPSGAELSVAYPYHPLLATIPADVAEERVRDELGALLGEKQASRIANVRWTNASWPIRALHELAEFEQAGLLVFGAAPERPGRRHLSLMERMVHGAPCAVALAPDGYADRRPSPRLAGVGIGFVDTPEGHAALRLGSALARLPGCHGRVIAGCGLSPELASHAAPSAALPAADEKLLHQTAAALAHALEQLAGDPGLRVDVRRGDPCRVLIEASAALDLLVLGARGYGPLRHALLGSVSADVMRSSACPVLVLPRRAGVVGGTAGRAPRRRNGEEAAR